MKYWKCKTCEALNEKITIVEFKNKTKHLEKRCTECNSFNDYIPKKDYYSYLSEEGKTQQEEGLRRFVAVLSEFKIYFKSKTLEEAKKKFRKYFGKDAKSIKQQKQKKQRKKK